MASPITVTTLDGLTVSATITATAHLWTADANGLFTTTADLKTEWTQAYATMLAGHGDKLTVLQRLEGNAEAVIENTGAAKLSAMAQAQFRQDTQREFDATYAAMTSNRTLYGINPNAQFNTYTYLKMEQTLQGDAQLKMLALEGHGLNSPPSATYSGFTTDFQNKVDGSTLYVGGGLDNGQKAIANFFDDAVLTHASFPTVFNNGVLEQLNQNGNNEDSLANVAAAANMVSYQRVYVASDFGNSSSPPGAYVAVPNQVAAPSLPTPVAPLTGVNSFDGGVATETISGLTVHTWTADGTGLYGTLTDLGAEWKGYYATMQSGHANTLTALQRMEGNAEAVFENTNFVKLTDVNQTAFRMDTQREYDAIDAAMRIDQSQYGINPGVDFTQATYAQMQLTLQNNETLKELAYQGHGLNSPILPRYSGYTTDFQNRTDGSTDYVGGGLDNGQNAISAFFDDVILTHAPFPVVEHNGVLTQLNQNGNFEDPFSLAVAAANSSAFDRVFVANDFSTNPSAVGSVVTVSGAGNPTTIAGGVTTMSNPDGSTTVTITGSGNTATVGSGTVDTGTGGNTVVLGAGTETVQSGGADTILGGTGPATVNTSGNAAIVGGAGAMTVHGGGGNNSVFAGTGGLTFNGSAGYDVVAGRGNPLVVNGGGDKGLFFGGGNATITAGTGGLSVLIGGNGDQLYSAGSTGDLFGATGGSLLMSGIHSTGNDVFFGAGGSGTMTFITGTGNDLMALGQGTNNVTLGSGFNYIFGNTGTTGMSTIASGTGSAAIAFGGKSMNLVLSAVAITTREFDLYGFTPGADKISLSGYTPGAAATAVAGQISTAGGAIMHLGDGTTISLVGVMQATTGMFG